MSGCCRASRTSGARAQRPVTPTGRAPARNSASRPTPKRPRRSRTGAPHGNLEAAAHEKVLVVDDAEIAVELAAPVALGLGQVEPVVGRTGRRVHRQPALLLAAASAR